MKNWIDTLLKKGIPAGVKLLVIDHVSAEHFAFHERQHPGMLLSIHIPMDLHGAIKKLAAAGNPNDPEIMLRKCVFEMGAAMKDKDVKRLHRWGQQALDATQRSGNKGLFATAHIMYAGMLFHFKKDPKIPELLERGQRIARQGSQQGDGACLPLLVQFYGYHGAYAQIRRRFTEAINWFIQQGELAEQHKFSQQALNAWYQAAELCRRKDSSRYYDVLEKGYQAGWHLPDEEISASIYIYLLRDYYDYAHANRKHTIIQDIDDRMIRVFGEDWKSDVDNIRKKREPLILPLEMEQSEATQSLK
jgi:elongation factor P hydroxylase